MIVKRHLQRIIDICWFRVWEFLGQLTWKFEVFYTPDGCIWMDDTDHFSCFPTAILNMSSKWHQKWKISKMILIWLNYSAFPNDAQVMCAHAPYLHCSENEIWHERIWYKNFHSYSQRLFTSSPGKLSSIYSNNDRDIMFPFPLRDLLTVQGHTYIAARSNTALHSSWKGQIAKFIGPTWGPPGSSRPQMGPMLAPWTLLSG